MTASRSLQATVKANQGHNRLNIIALVLLGVLSVAVLFVSPVLVGAMVTQLGFTEAQAGGVISAELLGMSVATFAAIVLAARWPWQRLVATSLILMLMGNLLSSQVSHYGTLLVLRFAIGLAAGVSMSTCIAMIAGNANPDRVYGLWVSGQLIFGALGLYLLPKLLIQFGFGFFYLLVAIFIGLFLTMVRHLPEGAQTGVDHRVAALSWRQPGQRLALLGIVAIFVFYIGQYSVWVYLERIGVAAGLPSTTIAEGLSVAALIGIAGALGAAVLHIRYGRLGPVLLALIVSLMAMGWLSQTGAAGVYVLSVSAFSFSFNFILPYLMAGVAQADSSGRLIMLTNLASGGGLAVGPLIGGNLLQSSGVLSLVTLAVVLTLISIVMAAPVLNAKTERPAH
ncbi:MFS transporter [Pseudomaricurvus alkylphenolicus]|uniref:MFS transporter n=1 Tax=Pseudomaricurvus alkylphenolicus TaxID=1306991 RepID=UPI001420B2D3|nr:MFS transporter [Pseudomaricurvus alkylphenolicus]NIB40778.1 MFS transporter [Pseudomaricurvus alkylphenolicus]